MEEEMDLMIGMREVRYRTKGGVWKEDGMFHKWVVLGDRVYGIVEQPDGTVVVVRHIDIQFTDLNEEKGETE
jgi:hypothetical protein